MKNLLTLKDLQLKYEPDILINKIEENYLKHKVLLLNLFSIDLFFNKLRFFFEKAKIL